MKNSASIDPGRGAADGVTILFLAANPRSTERLELTREFKEIKRKIKMAKHRERVRLEAEWDVSLADVLDELNDVRPNVVHFSGHGAESGNGLMLEGEGGRSKLASAGLLDRLFGSMVDRVRVVVLNACWSDGQAKAIAKHVDCVVGMGRAISDKAAQKFAVAFYSALAAGTSVQVAFEQGCLLLHGTTEIHTPQLREREVGIAARVVLVGEEESKVKATKGRVAGANAKRRGSASTRGNGGGSVVGSVRAKKVVVAKTIKVDGDFRM